MGVRDAASSGSEELMVTTNKFRPTQYSFNSYGWTGSSPYNSPVYLQQRASAVYPDRKLLEQQFAYEWLDLNSPFTGRTNPPFTKSAAGALIPSIHQVAGGPARILRGYIRRSQYDAGDELSKARLYFMYNPEQVIRD